MATLLDKVSSISKPQVGTVAWLNARVERGASGIFSEVVDVTPGLAGEILRRNPDNRPVKAKVENYAADMIDGRWVFNGEPIIISDDGFLNDGQHRLLAIIDANKTIPLLIVFGVSRVSRMTVDQGSARSAGDYLGMDNVPNAKTAASLTRIVMAIENGDGTSFADASRVTNEQIRRRVIADDKILEAAAYAQSVHKHCCHFIAPALVGAAYYMFCDINPIEGRDYMDRVTIGEGLRRGQPAFAVREGLMREGRNRRAAKIELLMHGWNKFRSNGAMKLAKVNNRFPALI